MPISVLSVDSFNFSRLRGCPVAVIGCSLITHLNVWSLTRVILTGSGRSAQLLTQNVKLELPLKRKMNVKTCFFLQLDRWFSPSVSYCTLCFFFLFTCLTFQKFALNIRPLRVFVLSTGRPPRPRHSHPSLLGALWEHPHDHLAGYCLRLQGTANGERKGSTFYHVPTVSIIYTHLHYECALQMYCMRRVWVKKIFLKN